MQPLIDEYSAPACFESLFSILILENNETIEIKKVFNWHQLVIDYLAQMKMDMDAELKEAFVSRAEHHTEIEVV